MDFWKEWGSFVQQEEELKWEGTFREYLKIVEERPQVARSAHARLYDMIRAAGVERGGGGKIYLFFKDKLFGINPVLERLVEDYLHPAALGMEVRKRILLLMGPVSGGKSTIVTLLKRGLEAYSRTEEGALYGIKDCPMHEEPLHLVPVPLREKLARQLGVVIEGRLCPFCQFRVQHEFKGVIEEVPVERIFLSEANRVGIGTFSPSDPKSQDIAELVGSLDFAALDKYGSESDPRAYRFDGELNRANRGLLEFQELLKCDEKFLYHLLSLTQEGNFKTSRYALISADEVIIAHTNEPEYQYFIRTRGNDALKSRLMVIPVPYPLDTAAEKKIYIKSLRESRVKVHTAPFTLDAVALFAVLTRVKEEQPVDREVVAAIKAYGDAQNHRLDYIRDQVEKLAGGMQGIDPRFIQERLSSVFARHHGHCVTPLDVINSLRQGLREHPGMTAAEKKRYLLILGLVEKEYDRFAQKELRTALLRTFAKEGQGLFKRYMQALQFYEEGEINSQEEELLHSVEKHVRIPSPAKHQWRTELLRHLKKWQQDRKEFDYKAHPELKEAIEEKLFQDVRSLLRLSILSSGGEEPKDGNIHEDQERCLQILYTMGYCRYCGEQLLTYGGRW